MLMILILNGQVPADTYVFIGILIIGIAMVSLVAWLYQTGRAFWQKRRKKKNASKNYPR